MSQELIIKNGNASLPEDRVVVQAQVTTEDVVLIATTEHQAYCEQEVAAWQSDVSKREASARAMREEIAESLQKAATEFVRVKVAAAAPFYQAWGLPFSSEVTADWQQDGLVAISTSIYSAKTKKSYGGGEDKTFHFEAPDITVSLRDLGLSDKSSELKKLEDEVKAARENLRKWHQEIAHLPAFERQTRAKMAELSLQRSDAGSAIVTAIKKLGAQRMNGMPSLVQHCSPCVGIEDKCCAEMAVAKPVKKVRKTRRKKA